VMVSSIEVDHVLSKMSYINYECLLLRVGLWYEYPGSGGDPDWRSRLAIPVIGDPGLQVTSCTWVTVPGSWRLTHPHHYPDCGNDEEVKALRCLVSIQSSVWSAFLSRALWLVVFHIVVEVVGLGFCTLLRLQVLVAYSSTPTVLLFLRFAFCTPSYSSSTSPLCA
jgi:hypothetical protein